MTLTLRKPTLTVLLGGLLLAGLAHAGQADHIQADQGWIRVLPGNLPAAAYVTLKNTGGQTATLRGARGARYASVMLHQSTTMNGMDHMSAVADLAIPAHGVVRLAPGGYHLMLMQPTSAVNVGEVVKLTLIFADDSTLKVDFTARPANAVDAATAPTH